MTSHLENQFSSLWLYYHPAIDFFTEYRFTTTRRYRLDFAHPATKIGIEINGGTWRKSGHSSGSGLRRDYEKINLLSSLGWRLFCLSGDMITIENLETIARTIKDEL